MKVFLVDIDGTIADNKHREHLAHVKAWDEFFDQCDGDTPIEHMRTLLNQIVPIVYVTGRPERVRAMTKQWLATHGFPPGIAIKMRQDGDHRPDHIIKREVLTELIKLNIEPIMAFDDRNTVVKMWRANGVPCAQVVSEEQGDF